MFGALRLTAASASALLCLCSATLAQFVPTPDFSQGDAERGKRVYQHVGYCANCHGWPGDGQSGRNPMAHSGGANLRESKLNAQGLYDTIRCGIPGTQMPYHDSASYRDGRCFGKLLADYDDARQPIMGKTFSEKSMVDLIAYLQKYVLGRGRPTYDECVLYFDKSAGAACAYLKDD
jgi:hypothetical protein